MYIWCDEQHVNELSEDLQCTVLCDQSAVVASSMWLSCWLGRSLLSITRTTSQPCWIFSAGLIPSSHNKHSRKLHRSGHIHIVTVWVDWVMGKVSRLYDKHALAAVKYFTVGTVWSWKVVWLNKVVCWFLARDSMYAERAICYSPSISVRLTYRWNSQNGWS